jgi:hypothetical protein
MPTTTYSSEEDPFYTFSHVSTMAPVLQHTAAAARSDHVENEASDNNSIQDIKQLNSLFIEHFDAGTPTQEDLEVSVMPVSFAFVALSDPAC